MTLANVTCSDIGFIVNIVKWVIKIIQFGIPLILIVMVIFDLVKIANKYYDDQKPWIQVRENIENFNDNRLVPKRVIFSTQVT